MRAYQDFTIKIGAREGDIYPVHVVDSPAGTGDGELRLPSHLLPGVVDPTLLKLGTRIRGGERALGTPTSTSEQTPEDIGAELFEALFTDTVMDLYLDSMGRAEALHEHLRLKLHLNLLDPSIAALAGLPWELLYYREQRKPLVLGGKTAIVRHLTVPVRKSIPTFAPPLRVLIAIANPLGDLDVNKEQAQIEARLSGLQIEHEVLKDVTFAKLEEELHRGDHHIVHFMGHGAFEDGAGVLLFDQGDKVTGTDLADLLRSKENARLVVLNACETGQAARLGGQDPFCGVASALVMAGVPSVVAMQFPVSDTAAIAFAERFYESIARQVTIEEAVDAGRLKIKGVLKESSEWATPVLFSYVDGDLFASSTAPLETTGEPADPWEGGVSNGGPLLEEDALDLLPYMTDRRELVRSLDSVLQATQDKRHRPLVAIVHGADGEALDKMWQRLQQEDLPKLLELDQRSGCIKDYSLKWPKDYGSREDFHERLTWELNQAVGRQHSSDGVQAYFASHPAPVMVGSEVSSSSRSNWEDVLEDYVDYWRSWPVIRSAHRLLAFLFIRYVEPKEPGWFNKNAKKAHRLNERIRAALDTLSSSADPSDDVVCEVLPELGEVTEDDVIVWRTEKNVNLSDRQIRPIFDRWEETHGRRTMPMGVVGEELELLLFPGGVT